MRTTGQSFAIRVLTLLLVAAVPISVLTANPNWLSKLTYAVEVGQAKVSQSQLETATDLSQAFRHVARSIRPSVVSISSIRRVKPSQPNVQRFGSPLPDELRGFFQGDPFEKFFEFRMPERGFEHRGLGSGVIVSEDGYILTNNHVVGEADEVNVTLSDNRQFHAELVGTDKATDLAVLKIDAAHLQPAALGDSGALEVGEWVLAMGSPFGLDQTVTAGIISAKSRANVGLTDYEDFLQTDAAINPGNSGGPLVNLHGEVVGINTAIASRNGGYMGVGFAIPSAIVRHVMDSIIAEGHVTRGWLGAMIQDLDEDLAESFGYDSADGVLIGDLVDNGPGQKAGLRAGDIVVQFDGQAVKSANELRNAVARTQPDKNVKLKVFREGELTTLTIEIGQLEENSLQMGSSRETAADLGMSVGTLTSDEARQLGMQGDAAGVLVTNVEAGSLAARVMIRPQDVIVSVGGEPVTSVARFRELMAEQDLEKGIRMQVVREGFKRFVFVRGE
jgi:serine protease Do